MSIKLKIISLTALSCTLLLCGIMANIFYQEKNIRTQVDQDLETLMLNNTKNVVQNVSSQLKALNEVLLAEVNSGLKVSRNVMNNLGTVELSSLEKVTWKAINQFDKEVSRVHIPKMMIGGKWLGQNSTFATSSAVVDHAKKLVGGTTTIFQRINERGDMLRVCTNVKKLNNNRAIGTYIPAINPDGSENAVVSTLMSGKTFYGRAFVVNAWYLTSYEPIYDENKKIIGALYYGIMQEKTKALRDGITDTVLGTNGYIYVLDRKGNYIISKGGTRDGDNVWNNRDEEGTFYIQNIIKKALQLKQGEVEYQRYKHTDFGESEAQMKVAAITYFEPWDWIIGAGAYENDFKTTKFKLQNSINKMVKLGAIIGGAITIFILLLAIIVSEKITRPIEHLTEAAEDISLGNLKRKINIQSRDETGKLASAFKRMQASLVIVAERKKK